MEKGLFILSLLIILLIIGTGCTTQNDQKTTTQASTFSTKFKPDDIISFTPSMEESVRSYLNLKGIDAESKKIGALITKINETRISQNSITKENSIVSSYDYIVVYQVQGNNWRREPGMTGWEVIDFVDSDPTRVLVGNLRSLNLQNR